VFLEWLSQAGDCCGAVGGKCVGAGETAHGSNNDANAPTHDTEDMALISRCTYGHNGQVTKKCVIHSNYDCL